MTPRSEPTHARDATGAAAPARLGGPDRADGASRGSPPPRPWNRLAFRLAAFFAVISMVAVGLVGFFLYERQKRDIEATLGVQLLHIARLGALQIDPELHAEVQRTLDRESEAYRRIRTALATIQDEVLHRVDPGRIEREAEAAGFAAAGRRAIDSGPNEADSIAVLLEVKG